jgi:RNA polymerase sigma-70 factor, ECF subfamily
MHRPIGAVAVNASVPAAYCMAGTSPALVAARESDAIAASAVKGLQAAGEHADARERYAELVARHQRRASRIAYHYLRDAAEADEAVQDAFVKAYQHLASFREELPFDVWFTRILINGCLDRIKARTRRERWLLPMSGRAGGSSDEGATPERDMTERVPAGGLSPEEALLGRERRREIAGALAKLPERQRSVFVLSHVEGRTSREVSALTGLNESTVRVHLFRAIRRLRTLLTVDGTSIAGERKGKRRVTS